MLSVNGRAVRVQLQADLTLPPPPQTLRPVKHPQPQPQNQENDIDDNNGENDDDDNLLISSVSILPEPPTAAAACPYTLSQPLMVQIAQKGLPPSLLFAKWTRLYSLARDGDSFDTMLRLVKHHPRTLLVVKSATNQLFGGFVDSPWEMQRSNNQVGGFYGSARAMLFRVRWSNDDDGCDDDHDCRKADEDYDDDDRRRKGIVKVYKWSGANRYIQLCDLTKKKLAMGGGGSEGSFGLCVEDDFRRGSTGRCETFGNEPLSAEEQFEILDLEVWGFITGVF